jgi:hypothetical protein
MKEGQKKLNFLDMSRYLSQLERNNELIRSNIEKCNEINSKNNHEINSGIDLK